MPPRLNIWGACRSLALRSRPQAQIKPQQLSMAAIARQLSSDATPPPSDRAGISAANGSMIPNIPSSMMPPGETPPIREEDVQMRDPTPNEEAVQQLVMTARGFNPFNESTGLKFQEPPMPMDKLERAQYHMRYRYDEGISLLTRLLMRDGKLSKAQNDMAMLLNYLRTSPAPRINPQRPLLPGSPPPEHLPLNPNLYLMLAIDSVAPLVRIRGFTGLAGGGKALEVPVPLSKRARRRMAFMWILDAVKKRPSMGSGKKMLAHRIGEEVVAVVEGTSSLWDRRNTLHKLGTSVRANLNSSKLLKRKI